MIEPRNSCTDSCRTTIRPRGPLVLAFEENRNQHHSEQIFSCWRNQSRPAIPIPVHKPFFTEPDSRRDPVREPDHLTAFASRGLESATPDRWPLTCSKLIGEVHAPLGGGGSHARIVAVFGFIVWQWDHGGWAT